jgi:hypothetical protein
MAIEMPFVTIKATNTQASFGIIGIVRFWIVGPYE